MSELDSLYLDTLYAQAYDGERVVMNRMDSPIGKEKIPNVNGSHSLC